MLLLSNIYLAVQRSLPEVLGSLLSNFLIFACQFAAYLLFHFVGLFCVINSIKGFVIFIRWVLVSVFNVKPKKRKRGESQDNESNDPTVWILSTLLGLAWLCLVFRPDPSAISFVHFFEVLGDFFAK